MNQKNSIHQSEPCILVEGPEWGDAEFYGKWLLKAANAEALWKEALNDPSFWRQVNRLWVAFIPNFGMFATDILSRLRTNFVSFALGLDTSTDGELVEEFVMMAKMGFLILTGRRYQIAIPEQMNMDTVKRAALMFAKTEDEESYLHPEYLVATMPYAEAKAWQERLRKMDDAHRCADRLLLLDGANGAA